MEETIIVSAKGFTVSRILIIVSLIVGIACTPIIVNQVQTLYTGGWNFTGHEGAAQLFNLVPFVWVSSMLVGIVASVYRSIQSVKASVKFAISKAFASVRAII